MSCPSLEPTPPFSACQVVVFTSLYGCRHVPSSVYKSGHSHNPSKVDYVHDFTIAYLSAGPLEGGFEGCLWSN